MNPIVYVLPPLALLVTGWLGWWFRGHNNQRLFARASEVLTHQLDQARAEAADARAKTARYLAKITDFEQERDRIQHLYDLHAIGHGNAQQLMMNTIEDMAKLLQQKGVRFTMPKVLRAVREEYLTNHEMPVRAALEAAKQAQPEPTAASETP